jgi:ferric iron reductase protein FhuF
MQFSPDGDHHGQHHQRARSTPSYSENAKALQEIKDHLREDIENVDEPQLRAMFETSAEVLSGLIKAFRDYEQKNETAWRR